MCPLDVRDMEHHGRVALLPDVRVRRGELLVVRAERGVDVPSGLRRKGVRHDERAARRQRPSVHGGRTGVPYRNRPFGTPSRAQSKWHLWRRITPGPPFTSAGLRDLAIARAIGRQTRLREGGAGERARSASRLDCEWV